MSRRHILVIALVGLAALGCYALVASPKRPDGGSGLLTIGAVAPDFSARDATGKQFTVTSLRGRSAVVFFYPRDGTPGCTKEACAFRDNFDEYARRGATLIGVSSDSEHSHDKFRADHKLPFALASDESGAIARAYGVKRFAGLTKRVTFVIDKDGKVLKVFPEVDPGIHAQEVFGVLPR
jgi:peroxiredoxin Q/BCP